MDFKVSGRNIEVTEAIKSYAEKKAGKLLRYFDRIQEITVVIGSRDRQFECEILVDIEHKDAVVAKAHADDLYASIDLATDKAERQLTDLKNKIKDHHKS